MKHFFPKPLYSAVIMLLSFVLSYSALAEDEVKNFAFLDLEGEKRTFSENDGKWVIVNYWATYCSPCLEEIPDLIRFTKHNSHRVAVLGFDAGGSTQDELADFSEEHGINYLVAPMQTVTMTAFGKITAIPMSFIISPENQLIARVIGVLDVDKVEQLMDAYEEERRENPYEPF